MHSQILKTVKEKHTNDMRCLLMINWDMKGLSIEEGENAFIVQKLRIEQTRDGEPYRQELHYFEAWKVKNGKIQDSGNQCDDMFAIGRDIEFLDKDLIKDSIGHKGSVIFTPKVYVVRENSELYSQIEGWPNDKIQEANGLRAVLYTEETEKEFEGTSVFEREVFRHDWQFDDSEVISRIMLEHCKKVKSKKEEIEYLFEGKEEYSDIKERIIS